MKVAPDRIYLRVAPSGAIMPVIHTEPPKGSQKSVQYVRADLLDVKTLLELNKTYADRMLDASLKRERDPSTRVDNTRGRDDARKIKGR